MYRLNRVSDSESTSSVYSLGDLIGHSDLRELWVFNDDVDVDWLLEHLQAPEHIKIRIIYGATISEMEKLKRQWLDVYRQTWRQRRPVVAWCIPQVSSEGSHNTRMVILRRDAGLQVVILTTKLEPAYWETPITHPIWASPLLPVEQRDGVSKADSTHQFQQELVRFLREYEMRGISPPGRGDIRQLMSLIDSADFNSVGPVHFVASVPGQDNGWGVAQISPLLAQSTSVPLAVVNEIGKHVSKKWLASQPQADTYIVYPTSNEVKDINARWGGCYATDAEVTESLSPCRPPPGRGPCIGNLYLGITDELSETAEWAIVTSAPLSQASWGYRPIAHRQEPSGCGSEDPWRLLSWEAGVLIQARCVLFTDTRIFEDEQPYIIPCQWPPDIYVPGKDIPAAGELIEENRDDFHEPVSQSSFSENKFVTDILQDDVLSESGSEIPSETRYNQKIREEKTGISPSDSRDVSVFIPKTIDIQRRKVSSDGSLNSPLESQSHDQGRILDQHVATTGTATPSANKKTGTAFSDRERGQVSRTQKTPKTTPGRTRSSKKDNVDSVKPGGSQSPYSSKKKRRVIPFSRDRELRLEFDSEWKK